MMNCHHCPVSLVRILRAIGFTSLRIPNPGGKTEVFDLGDSADQGFTAVFFAQTHCYLHM